MKRLTLVLAFIIIAAFLVIGSLSNTVQAARPNLDTGGRGQPEQAEQQAAPNVLLLDQYNSPLNNYIVSANRTDNPTFSAEAADDFVVPAGQTWEINQVDVRSPAGFPNPTSFNVYIYTDSGTLPGTPVYTATNLAVGGTNPDYVINLTTPADLATGTYWVSVQGNIVGANWYWQGRSVVNNNSTAWREAGGYATGCLNWTRLTTCSGFTWPGQMFRLHGTIGGGGSPTSTVGPTNTTVPTTAVPTSTRTNTAIPTSTSTATVIPILTNTQTTVPTGTTAASVTSVSTSTATSVSTSVATSTATVTACTITFSDVDETNPFYTWIRCLSCRGIIGGYSDGTFKPFNEITRGQIAKMVSNAAGFNDDPGPQIFEDVPLESPFFTWINRLTNQGAIGGYPCGQNPNEPCIEPDNRPYFRPNANATRGQLAKIVANAAGLGGTPTGQFYSDVDTDHTFYVWVMRLTELGAMSGYPCGGEGEPCDEENRPYFRPYNNVTRGQASKIVANTFFPNCETPVGR
jgi:hypothetical protein